jgi:uncharacterized protein with von Willebrand factor type A (vWA) domain
MSHAFVPNVLLFGRLLRRAGLEVHPGRMLDALTAIEYVGIRSREDVRATLCTLLVHRREDLRPFEDAFDLFWRSHEVSEGGLPLFPLGERPRVIAKRVSASDVGLEIHDVTTTDDGAPRLAAGAYSYSEVLRSKDFAELTDDELRRAETLLADMGWRLGTRRTRRWRRGASGAVDIRHIARVSLKYGGEPIELPRRQRVEKPRPIVALCDVSGSMERYSHMLLQFLFGLARGTARAESFLFATRLTRVTWHMSQRRARPGISALARTVQDWGGGTRIGESLRAFNVHWARRVMRSEPIVLIVSDGWDRGDPELLAREMARLRRRCHRLIWLNPLLGSASYEPLTRGMLAALDHVDEFLPAHNLASLEQLAVHLVAGRVSVVGRVFRPGDRPLAWKSSAATRSTPR